MGMKLSKFGFELPEELLVEYPAEHRDESRLMVLNRKEQTIEHKKFKDLIDYFDEGDLLVIGWGGTYGSLHSAVKQLNNEGFTSIGFAHFNYINPMPKNTEEVISKFKKVIVCELNNGQFASILKINFSHFEFLQLNKIQGLPFANAELTDKFKELVK